MSFDRQRKVLQEFMNVFNFPTLKEASTITGIQKTRFFRLFHGYQMRLDEYLILQQLIRKKRGMGQLDELVAEVEEKLGSAKKQLIENQLKAIIRQQRYEELA